MSHELIYQKYNDKPFFDQSMDHQMTKMGVKDQDLIIDLKFGDTTKIQNMYLANQFNMVSISENASQLKEQKIINEIYGEKTERNKFFNTYDADNLKSSILSP
jgi:hypothetical protein